MSEYKKIVFFNGHQHGDIANSRGVVSYITKQLGNSYEYFFLHHRLPDSILFGENIPVYNQYGDYGRPFPFPLLGDIKLSHEMRHHYVMDDMIFLNVWIGCSPYYKSNRAPNGHGITRVSLLEQTIECINYLKEAGNIHIPHPSNELDVLPCRLGEPRNKHLVNELLERIRPNYRKLILIPNGPVESGQVPQFNFGDQIQSLIRDTQDVGFIFTAKNFNTENSNVYFVDDYFPIPNLTEIDYLSNSCDVLITRASGPGCIISTVENYLDTSKTFISLTANPRIGFEALCSHEEIENRSWGSENTAKMIWSNDFSPENLCKIIGESIS